MTKFRVTLSCLRPFEATCYVDAPNEEVAGETAMDFALDTEDGGLVWHDAEEELQSVSVETVERSEDMK